jgi:hypothetical protein
MELACPRCSGRCGATWQRAVVDSNDSKIAHWTGRCELVEGARRV